jgi:3-phosphoshikimate 1-carboxyvinyltransferase
VIVTINPEVISGNIAAPASKSCMQRACAMALLANGQSVLRNPGKSNDDLAALDIIQKLGATVSRKEADNLLVIDPSIAAVTGEKLELHCGESGLGIRMFAPVAALSSREITITGTGSLLNRPMHFFDEVFPKVGVSIQSNKGYLPITIKGPLQPADITVDGSQSSQYLTGLLIAFAKAATKPVTITVQNLNSKPYVDLTLQMLKTFGYAIDNNNYESFYIQPVNAIKDDPLNYTVEGDWSSAAGLLVAGAIAGNITLTGLDVFSTQADKAILQALMDSGANISIETEKITVSSPAGVLATVPGARGLKAFHFNATDCPDLFPPLVALAAYCSGTTVIEGAGRLQHKESDRALTLQQEFAKMGVAIELQDDLMMISGGGKIKGANVFSHHDHRIAMACAVAALQADGKTVIEDAEAVNKSYPQFYEDLKSLNADVYLEDVKS